MKNEINDIYSRIENPKLQTWPILLYFLLFNFDLLNSRYWNCSSKWNRINEIHQTVTISLLFNPMSINLLDAFAIRSISTSFGDPRHQFHTKVDRNHAISKFPLHVGFRFSAARLSLRLLLWVASKLDTPFSRVRVFFYVNRFSGSILRRDYSMNHQWIVSEFILKSDSIDPIYGTFKNSSLTHRRHFFHFRGILLRHQTLRPTFGPLLGLAFIYYTLSKNLL